MRKEKGITLIALVVTIIILLILAGVSLQIALGENGLFTYSRRAGEEHCHSAVKEALEMSASTHEIEKLTNNDNKSLIEYLEEKGIVEDIGEEGNYQINVEKLLGSKMQLGNGSDRKDVYMLEENKGTAELGKYATTGEIKIAEASSGRKEYKIMYYGKTEDKIRNLGTLKDGTNGTEDTSGIRIEDMYYLEGEYNDETGKIENISLSLLPGVQMELVKIVLDNVDNIKDEDLLAQLIGYETFDEMVEELYKNGDIDKKYTNAKDFFIDITYISAINSIKDKLKENQSISEEEIEKMTDEEILAKYKGYETFDEMVEELYKNGDIDKKYKTAKELLIASEGGTEAVENEYKELIAESRQEIIQNFDIYDYNGDLYWGDDSTEINGIGDYKYTVKIYGREIYSFTITIDQYEIIDWTGKDIWQAVSVYDFKNEKILKINEASYEYLIYDYENHEIGNNWQSGVVPDEKIFIKDEGSYIKIKMIDNYIFKYKILSNGKYIIGYVEGRSSSSAKD